MNILLTTSAAPDQAPFSTTEKRPPLGIGFLIAVLKKAGHNVFFIDNYLKPSNFIENDFLIEHNIDYIGIYANTICLRDTLRMCYKIEYLRQKKKWKGKIIVGGPHTTVAPETIPDFVDHIVQGEGERAILEIVEGKHRNRIVRTERINDLDSLPMPAWDYFVKMPYHWQVDWFPQHPVFTMNTSRGCPFKCAFCSVGSIWGKRYTFFSAERIVDEIQFLIKQYGAAGIYFREDNFTLNRKRLIKFCELLLEKDIKIPWACETRVSSLDNEIVDLMSRAGACGFYFGVESGSQKILNDLKKGITVDEIIKAFELCHRYKINTAASVIVGTPTETEDDLRQTFELIKKIKPTVTWYNVFVGIPNSKLHQYCLKNDLYEFIDDRGLGYLKNHNERVKKFYGDHIKAEVPIQLDRQGRITSPKVSIIMSVFNGEKYLESAVNSILRQSFLDFEFIIINDGSTDNTEKILKRFTDKRLKIINNKTNIGLTASLNKAIKQARGEFIARMDADDISLPFRLEYQVKFLEENPDIALVGSSYYICDEKNKIQSIVEVLTEPEKLKQELKKQNWFGHGTVMFRKNIIDNIGAYDESYKYAQDYELWLRIANKFKVANIKEPLYIWRRTKENISSKKEEEQAFFAQKARNSINNTETKKHQKNKPLISVIIPTCDRPYMLKDAINSIFNQTIDDFEIIVINDGKSELEELISHLNIKGNITYIKHNNNRGLPAARNSGLKLARGKYIAYLDDDDIFYPNHFETLLSVLEKDGFKIAYSDAYRAIQIKEGKNYKTVKKEICYSNDFDPDLLLVQNIAPVNCFIHERECLKKTGFFDESLTTHEDWDFWIRCSRHFNFKHVPEVTCEFRYRLDRSSMTGLKRQDFLRTANIIYKKYRKYTRNNLEIINGQIKFLQELKKSLFQSNKSNNPFSDNEIDRTSQYMKRLSSFSTNLKIWEKESFNWKFLPIYSLFMILKETELELLADTLDSLGEQIYGNWRLRVISPHACISPIFDEHDELAWIQTESDNYWEIINQKAFEDEGDWLFFLRPGDRLYPHSLASLTNIINKNRNLNFIYSDHDIRDKDGKKYPYFKPNINLDFLRSSDYIKHAFFIRKQLFKKIGGFDPRLRSIATYDLTLRAYDKVSEKEIFHIEDILLSLSEEKSTSEELELQKIASKLAIQNHLNRNNLRAQVIDGSIPETYRCVYDYEKEPLVSILIPTKDQVNLLRSCINSIINKTKYTNFEILIINNNSKEKETIEFFKKIQKEHPSIIKIINYDKHFNYSEANNIGASYAKGDFILLLNNDIEIIQENWLNIMVSYCQRKETGAVGVRLLFPDGSLQHAGVGVGLFGAADHFFIGYPPSHAGYMNRLQVDQNFSAVTGACMLVKREAFDKVGGLDQENYQLNFSDIDFCLKLGRAGYRIVWTPYVTLLHHTSVTQRKEAEDPQKAKNLKEQFEKDKQAFIDKWFPVLCHDPAYNYNLSLDSKNFEIDLLENPGWSPAILDVPRLWGYPRAKDGAGEYRVRRPFIALQEHGKALTHCAKDLLMPNGIERHRPDTILFQTPTGEEAIDYLKLIRKYHDGLIIFEIDDLLHHIPFKNPAFQNLKGKNLKQRIKTAVSYCDRMVVSTEPLAEAYKGFCKDIRVVPNYISRAIWGELRPDRQNGERPRIGWAGGAYHYGDLMVIKDVVKALADEVDWIFMGMCPDEIRPFIAEFHEGVDIDEYPAKLATLDLDLAVAPLEVNAFNKAKSNLRILEYGILGWPVIATDIYPYQGAPVTLVKNRYKAWLKAIRDKLSDRQALIKEGEELRNWVLENWILEDHLEEILDAYT